MVAIYTIPDTIDNEIIEWLSWRYRESFNENHLLFLRHLSAIKDGFRDNHEYFIITEKPYKPTPNFNTLIETIIKSLDKKTDLIFLCHYLHNFENFSTSTISNIINKKEIFCHTGNQGDLKVYLISNSYAKDLIRLYDKPFRSITCLNIHVDLLKKGGRFISIAKPLFYRDDEERFVKYINCFYPKLAKFIKK